MSPGGGVVVYETSGGEVCVDVRFDRGTVWLTRRQMAELFGRDRSVVTRHIQNAFQEGELDPKATSAKFAQVQSRPSLNGVRRYSPQGNPTGKDCGGGTQSASSSKLHIRNYIRNTEKAVEATI